MEEARKTPIDGHAEMLRILPRHLGKEDDPITRTPWRDVQKFPYGEVRLKENEENEEQSRKEKKRVRKEKSRDDGTPSSVEVGDLAHQALVDVSHTWLGADVGEHVAAGDEMKLDDALLDPFTKSSVTDGDVPGTLTEVGCRS